MIDDIFGNPIVKMLLKKLPGFILRRFLTEDRLASFIQFSPRPTGEQVVFSGSDTPSIRIWLNIDNRGPFRVELDRLIIELWHKRFIGELYYLDRLVIEGGRMKEILVLGMQGIHFSDLKPSHGASSSSSIKIRGYFNSKIKPFKVITNNIESIHVDVIS